MPGIQPLARRTALAVTLLIAGCVPVTVNITFPQEKLEGAAGRIEDMVRSPENQPPAEPKKGPGSRLVEWLVAAVLPREAAAQGQNVDVIPEIRVRTPELMRAIEARRARRPQLEPWKAKGCIGETSQALLAPRPGDGCTAEVGALIAAENADRNYIVDTLIQQNNIPPSDAPRIRAAFAKARRERARPGEWVQEPNGQWVKR